MLLIVLSCGRLTASRANLDDLCSVILTGFHPTEKKRVIEAGGNGHDVAVVLSVDLTGSRKKMEDWLLGGVQGPTGTIKAQLTEGIVTTSKQT